MKQCSRCKRDLSETEFPKRKKGLRNWCKDCYKKCLINWRKKHPVKMKRYREKYLKTEKGKKKNRLAIYNWRKKHPKRYREINNRHNQTKERKEYIKNWKKEHPENIKRINAKRQKLNYVQLWNNPFPKEIETQGHHINDILVVPMPKKTHLNIKGKNHREHNAIWIEKLYCIDMEKILCQ